MPRATQVAEVEGVATETNPLPPIPNLVTKDELNDTVSRAVADALAGAIPELMRIMGESKEPTFGPGMGPSENVVMSITPTAEVKADYIKHYRLDGTVSGKFQELDMDAFEASGYDISADGVVMKGSWIHFQNDHFYAWTQNQVRYLDWKMENDPGSKIYEAADEMVLPCTVTGCFHVFATQAGLLAHLKGSHGLGR